MKHQAVRYSVGMIALIGALARCSAPAVEKERASDQAETSVGDGSALPASCDSKLGDYCPVGQQHYSLDGGPDGAGRYVCSNFSMDLCSCMRGSSGLYPMDVWLIGLNCTKGNHAAVVTRENPMCDGPTNRFCVVEPQSLRPGGNGNKFCWAGPEPQSLADIPVQARQTLCNGVGGTYTPDPKIEGLGPKNVCAQDSPICTFPQ